MSFRIMLICLRDKFLELKWIEIKKLKFEYVTMK